MLEYGTVIWDPITITDKGHQQVLWVCSEYLVPTRDRLESNFFHQVRLDLKTFHKYPAQP